MKFKTKIVLKDDRMFVTSENLLIIVSRLESAKRVGDLGILIQDVCTFKNSEYTRYGKSPEWIETGEAKIGEAMTYIYTLVESISLIECYNANEPNNKSEDKPNFTNDRIN